MVSVPYKRTWMIEETRITFESSFWSNKIHLDFDAVADYGW